MPRWSRKNSGGGADEAGQGTRPQAGVAVHGACAAPMRPLRVLLLPPRPVHDYRRIYTPDYGPDPFELERLLCAQGIELTTLDPAGRPFNPFAGKHSVLAAMDPWRALCVLLFRRRFDLVISVMDGPAAPLLLLRRLVGFHVPIVLWDLAPAERWQFRKRLQDFVVPRTAGIMTLTASQSPYIARRWSPTLPVMVVGSLIDTGFFHPLDLPADDYVFSVGQDVGRDYPTLLAAMEGVASELKLRTSRPLPEGTDRQRNVTVLRARVDDRQLRELYARCRFVVAPLTPTANANGVSTIQEAGAMGKALVVTDNPAIRDFIVPDKTCLVVPCGDAAAMRAAIVRLLNDADLCERLGHNARRFTEENSSPAPYAGRFGAAVRRFARAA
jgi:glycosyltransferase involved in cell wall biosynthesis